VDDEFLESRLESLNDAVRTLEQRVDSLTCLLFAVLKGKKVFVNPDYFSHWNDLEGSIVGVGMGGGMLRVAVDGGSEKMVGLERVRPR